MTAAAAAGNLPLMKWMHSQGCKGSTCTAAAAAGAGHIDILQWLHATGCPCDSNAPVKAAANAQQEALEWLIKAGVPFLKRYSYEQAPVACKSRCSYAIASVSEERCRRLQSPRSAKQSLPGVGAESFPLSQQVRLAKERADREMNVGASRRAAKLLAWGARRGYWSEQRSEMMPGFLIRRPN